MQTADLPYRSACFRRAAVVLCVAAAATVFETLAAESEARPRIKAALAEGVFELDDYRGIDGCLLLSNGDMEVVLAGNYTRRVLSIQTRGTENLVRVNPFRNDGAPRDFTKWLPLDGLRADTFGPAGENQIEALCYRHHELTAVTPRSVSFQSPVEPALAVRMKQTFSVAEHENRLDWTVALENVSSETRRWSVWLRNELRSDGAFLVMPAAAAPEKAFIGLDAGGVADAQQRDYMEKMFTAILRKGKGMIALAPGLFDVLGHKVVARAGRWSAAVRGRSVLTVTCPAAAEAAEYRMGGPLAAWLTQATFSMEAESPAADIAPGGSYSFTSEWRQVRLPARVETFEDAERLYPHIEVAALRPPRRRGGGFRISVGSSSNRTDAAAAVKEAFAEARSGLAGMTPHTFYFIDAMKVQGLKDVEAGHAALETEAAEARLIGLESGTYQPVSRKDFSAEVFLVAAFAGDIRVSPFVATGLPPKESAQAAADFERQRSQATRMRLHREKGRELGRKVVIPPNEPYFMLWAASTPPWDATLWSYEGFLDVMGMDAPCVGGAIGEAGRVYAEGRWHENAAMAVVLSGDFDYGVHCSVVLARTLPPEAIGRKARENLEKSLELLGGVAPPDLVVAHFSSWWSDRYNEKGANAATQREILAALPAATPFFGRYCAGDAGQVRNSGPNFSDVGLSFILSLRQRPAP